MLLSDMAIPALIGTAISGADASVSCDSRTLQLPEVFGIEIVNLSANTVLRHSDYSDFSVTPTQDKKPFDMCNVTITYTHPGLNDIINSYVWLPLQYDAWNARYVGEGGGGWRSGGDGMLSGAVARGFAAANTDGGHSFWGPLSETSGSSSSWALASTGNPNIIKLQDFAYRAVDETTQIAKQIIKSYYGQDPLFSYWNGCSTGGRQGLAMAQRFPMHYDGILAIAPAINWVTFVPSEYYSHVKMRQLGYFPPPCELQAITAAAVEACDGIDGVEDGLISAWGLCNFNATTVVGSAFDCEGERRSISSAAAEIANYAWTGPVRDGTPLWFGMTHDTLLASKILGVSALASTICKGEKPNTNCQSNPFPISSDWVKNWLVKDSDFDITALTEDGFLEALRVSRQEYTSIMDTSDPDLRSFHAAGGKIITWHGLMDQLIPPNGTVNYYERVAAISPDHEEFYRLFMAPGVQHCHGGPGSFPVNAFEQLMEWVEKGVAPEHLDTQVISESQEHRAASRPVCKYPLVAAYRGGHVKRASSYACAKSFDAFAEAWHEEL